ncbi:MAG: hypothetical protein BHW64_00315 [Candidatus Melainabacteria bacterium LEY3_CP_29_8]|nr:MAG: hypothetical protein BHW64_00315 [Candidatus Melainabacteria bacterium LEY3_CP_29_8]
MENNKNLSKLQIRSFVLSVIESLKFQNNLNYPNINDIITTLKSIEDKKTVCEILIKELLTSHNQSNIAIVSTLLLNCVDRKILENKLFEVLKDKKINDEKKSIVLEILTAAGKALTYDEYNNYFNDASKVINEDTIKLLNSAMVNPEAKIDFLDFFSSLKNDEKILLLDSLSEDYGNDLIVNLVGNIAYIENDNEILLTILDIFNRYKSPLAIEPLEFLSEYSNESKIRNISKKILKEYTFAKIDINKTKHITKVMDDESVLEPLRMTLPDGEGNIGIIVSRIIKSSGKIQVIALVANDISGITGCFGFSEITKEDFIKIVTKFSSFDEQVKLEHDYLMPLIKHFKEINFKTNNIVPYEFLCFEPLCKSETQNFDEKTSILSIIDDKFKDIAGKLNNEMLDSILNLAFIKKWFFNERQIESLKNVFDKIYETQDINIFEDYYADIFNESFKTVLKNRLKISALIYSSISENISIALYSLSLEENSHIFDNFLKILYKKSIYQHFLQMENNLTDSKKTLNIFFLKNKKNESIHKANINIINQIINEIETKWKMI